MIIKRNTASRYPKPAINTYNQVISTLYHWVMKCCGILWSLSLSFRIALRATRGYRGIVRSLKLPILYTLDPFMELTSGITVYLPLEAVLFLDSTPLTTVAD